MSDNPYIKEIKLVIPRLLALYDLDGTNVSYGLGDRFYWAWGLTDFGNATFQGGAHGLACLWRSGLWSYKTSSKKFLQRIDAIFCGTEKLTRSNGSLEEAFPNENSFCVTSLVAYDLLCTYDLLSNEINSQGQNRWLKIIQPLVQFIIKEEETHAIISNHLATAVAALTRWYAISVEAEAQKKAQRLLRVILDNQSNEGWFREYEGADPGYQSLCTYYMADIHKLRPDWNLLEPLRRSIKFLWHFAHPDGSFGGVYGSRCTRFYYPAGIEALSGQIPEAKVLAIYMRDSIANKKVVTLHTMDDSNLIPMFNAYSRAAAITTTDDKLSKCQASQLPCQAMNGRKQYPEAGLLVDGSSEHYSIINTHKGGVVIHFENQKRTVIDAGVVLQRSNGQVGSTQSITPENRVQLMDNTLIIHSVFTSMPRRLPNPYQFILLRILCTTIFKFKSIREWVKKCLVTFLITGKKVWPAQNRRTIFLGPNLRIEDTVDAPKDYTKVSTPGPFVSIHMASQGYWQIQDEETTT